MRLVPDAQPVRTVVARTLAPIDEVILRQQWQTPLAAYESVTGFNRFGYRVCHRADDTLSWSICGKREREEKESVSLVCNRQIPASLRQY